MIERKKLEEEIVKRIDGTDIFLVHISIKQGNIIKVLVDKPGGIKVEECVDLTRYINSVFDKDKEDYDLIVSSPGIGEPFLVREQYKNALNRPVELVISNGNKYKGTLSEVLEDKIIIDAEKKVKSEGKKKKKTEKERKEVHFTDIKSAKEIVSFK